MKERLIINLISLLSLHVCSAYYAFPCPIMNCHFVCSELVMHASLLFIDVCTHVSDMIESIPLMLLKGYDCSYWNVVCTSSSYNLHTCVDCVSPASLRKYYVFSLLNQFLA